MCRNSDMNLSLNGETFSILKEQFDNVLNRTVGNMEMKGADEAVVTLKLSISLEKQNRSTPDGNNDITIPKFKHDISSVMQVKDKASGQLVGDYQLVWDDEDRKYVMRKIDDGQKSLFDEDEPYGRFVDADYEVIEAGNTVPALTDGAESEEETETEEETDEVESGEPDAAKELKKDIYDESTPFGWLSQFVGEEMIVAEGMGNYTVRTKTGKIVLSSATSPDHPFYCNAEILMPHVGHELICAGYGEENITTVSIECKQCQEALFALNAPVEEEDDGTATGDDIEKLFDDEPEEKGYGYDEPED